MVHLFTNQPALKILIITHRVPFPQNGGYPIVVCNTIRGLVDAGHQVSLLSLNISQTTNHQIDEDPDGLLEQIRYQKFDLNISMSPFEAFTKLFNNQWQQVNRFFNPAFEWMLIKELRITRYDIIQLEGLYVTPYLNAISKYSVGKVVYRPHNIEHQVWERLAAQKGDPFKKWYLKLMASRIRKYELQQLNKFDAIAVFTDQDEQTMRDHGVKTRIDILPVGLDMSRYNPDFSKTEFPSLFFLGSLGWLPNREGIQWFLNTFYHDLVGDDLRVRFYVAGNDIPEQFDDYEAMGKIFIQGEVDDALEFVNSKAIMIVPLLSGGGMRVKIVEGMAMQKCIISTSLGAEGIHYTDGENILIANNREEFLAAIKKCITDEEFCKTIGRNARKLAGECYDLNVVAQKSEAFYQEVLSRR